MPGSDFQFRANQAIRAVINKHIEKSSAKIHNQIQLLLRLLLRVADLKYSLILNLLFLEDVSPVCGNDIQTIGPQQRNILYDYLAADLETFRQPAS